MSIINTKFLPPGFKTYMAMGIESKAYYDQNAYPYYGFTNWKTEDLGPYPKCLPIPRAVTRRFAIWLFGKPITLNFLGDDEIQKAMQTIWRLNRMDKRLVNVAIKGGKEGGVALKFTYDETDLECPCRISVLSCLDQVKFFYDPHNGDSVLMVRVQYPFFDYALGDWYYYREEWTNEEYVTYKPIKINNFGMSAKNPYLYSGSLSFPEIDSSDEWVVENAIKNKCGLIPIVQIKNWENESHFGEGDLFTLYRILDRVNLTYHLMDIDNQTQVDPKLALIDLEPKTNDGTDFPSIPGLMDLQSKAPTEEGEVPKQGKIQIIEAQGKMREHLSNYAKDMKEMIFDAIGAVFPRQEQITNKGSMTQSVLIQMYAPMVEILGEKRKSYGEDGICAFMKVVVLGLARLGVKPFSKLGSVSNIQDEKLHIGLSWFDQFMLSEDEKFAQFDRLDRETVGGYRSAKSAVVQVFELEELPLLEDDINEQTTQVEAYVKLQQEAMKPAPTIDKGRGNDSNGNAKDKSNSGSNRQSNRQQGRGATTKDAT